MGIEPARVDAQKWPNICYLKIRYPNTARNKFSVGTGTLIGPRVVLTAGHVVYDAAKGGWANWVSVTLGSAPRLSMQTKIVRTTRRWVEDDAAQRDTESAFDYGVVVLPQPVDEHVPPMAIAVASDGEFQGMTVNQAGYPVCPLATLGSLYGARAVLARWSPTRLYYGIESRMGQSGGPVYDFNPTTKVRTIRGVHTSYVDGTDGTGTALRITGNVLTLIHTWLGEFRP